MATNTRAFWTGDCKKGNPYIPSIDEVLANHAKVQRTLQLQLRNKPTTTDYDPVAKVLTTTELLESILLQLPLQTLVLASRVNKEFHTLIHTSPSLQRKLLILPPKRQPPTQRYSVVLSGPSLESRYIWKPSPPTDTASTSRTTDTTPLSVPLPLFYRPRTVIYHAAVPLTTLCPLLEQVDTPRSAWTMILAESALSAALSGVLGAVTPPMRTTARLRYLATSAGAWKQMQLSSPPTHKAHVKLAWKGRLTNGVLGIVLRTRDSVVVKSREEEGRGITLASLIDSASSARCTIDICHGLAEWIKVAVPNTSFNEQMKILDQQDSATVFDTSLYDEMKLLGQEDPGAGYNWSVAADSEVALDGLVVPTERETARLTATGEFSTKQPAIKYWRV